MLKTILGEAAGVVEVAGFGFPVLEAAVVIEFQIVCQNERHDAVSQALLEQQQAADAAVAVLKGVGVLKAAVGFPPKNGGRGRALCAAAAAGGAVSAILRFPIAFFSKSW